MCSVAQKLSSSHHKVTSKPLSIALKFFFLNIFLKYVFYLTITCTIPHTKDLVPMFLYILLHKLSNLFNNMVELECTHLLSSCRAIPLSKFDIASQLMNKCASETSQWDHF